MKLKKVLLFIFASLFFSSAMLGMFFTARAGAAPETAPEAVWSYAFEEGEGHFVEQTRDGAFVVAGKKGLEKSAASEIIMLKLKADSKQENGFLWSAGAAVVVFALVLLILRKTLTGKGGEF